MEKRIANYTVISVPDKSLTIHRHTTPKDIFYFVMCILVAAVVFSFYSNTLWPSFIKETGGKIEVSMVPVLLFLVLAGLLFGILPAVIAIELLLRPTRNAFYIDETQYVFKVKGNRLITRSYRFEQIDYFVINTDKITWPETTRIPRRSRAKATVIKLGIVCNGSKQVIHRFEGSHFLSHKEKPAKVRSTAMDISRKIAHACDSEIRG
jgi:hypothetical protein